MEEGRLAYRVRTAEANDATALRDAIVSTLAHPDHQGRRESYRGAASRGDILVLERYDRAAKEWQVAGFVECHMRVDDNLSIRDVGTATDEPQTGVVRYLLDQALNSFRPVEAQVKIRRDASVWLEIFRSIPGFYLEGEEYRRPHYWAIWRWDRQRARDAERASQASTMQQSQQPQRPRPPAPPPAGPASRGPRPQGPGGMPPGGPRPASPNGPASRDPRAGGSNAPGPWSGGPGAPGGSPARGPRPGGPSGPRPSGSGGSGRPPAPRPGRPPRRPSRPANPR